MWNLRDDWPQEYLPRDKDGKLIESFSLPISSGIDGNNLELTYDTGKNQLVIDISSSQDVEVLAITSGTTTVSGSTVVLISHVFAAYHFGELFQRAELSSSGGFPLSWFGRWIEAGRLPKSIHYENIKTPIADKVMAGKPIGKAGNHPNNGNKRVRICVEYADSTAQNLRRMHPREFFSLLFWEEKCDPILKDAPNQYEHPFLRKMMNRFEDGPAS